jgi:hypothetical protein
MHGQGLKRSSIAYSLRLGTHGAPLFREHVHDAFVLLVLRLWSSIAWREVSPVGKFNICIHQQVPAPRHIYARLSARAFMVILHGTGAVWISMQVCCLLDCRNVSGSALGLPVCRGVFSITRQTDPSALSHHVPLHRKWNYLELVEQCSTLYMWCTHGDLWISREFFRLLHAHYYQIRKSFFLFASKRI